MSNKLVSFKKQDKASRNRGDNQAYRQELEPVFQLHMRVYDLALNFFKKNTQKADRETQHCIEDSLFLIPQLYSDVG
jgi:hypothetical protein